MFTPASCNDCSPNLGSVVLENGRNVFFTAEQRAKFFVPAAGEFSNVEETSSLVRTFFNLDMTVGSASGSRDRISNFVSNLRT